MHLPADGVTETKSQLPVNAPETLLIYPPTGKITFFLGGTQLGMPVRVVGGSNPTNGTALVTASLSASQLPLGQSTIGATYSGDTNYAGSAAANLVVSVVDFVLSAGSNSINISSAGGTGTLSLKITPEGGFNSAVNFSCSGLPAQSRCSFSPASVLGGGTTTMTLSTAPSQSSTLAFPWPSLAPVFGCVFLLGIPTDRRRVGNKLIVLLLLTMLLTALSCGGGSGGSKNPGTPVGSYSMKVNATGGPVTHTIPITLNVQ